MAERPSDRAIAQAFTIESECRDLDDVRASLFVEHVLGRARTLDAAPADPVVSAECWRRAVMEMLLDSSGSRDDNWIEQRAREIAREGNK